MALNAAIVLKEGYRLKFLGTNILVSNLYEPRDLFLIDINSINHGEHIPRETDKPLEWDV
jgi:hypothetical protein